MGKVIAGMTISLDGFVHDKNGSVDALYPDFDAWHEVPSFQKMIKNTGAVVMGKRAFEMSEDPDWFAGNYEFQTPIFVLMHTPPKKHPKETENLTFTFVSDGIASAIAQAKQAAGEKDVQIVGGASTVQQALNAGLCDELGVDIIPVLLGEGLKLFEHINTGKITLERVKVEETTSVRTSLVFKVKY